MNTEIWVAIIACFGVCVSSILTTIVQLRKLRAEQAELSEKQKQTLVDSINANRNEYLNGISEVKDSIQTIKDNITDMKASYQTTVATISLQIQNLEKKQDKHNSVIERTYALERDVEVLKNRESVSEHRLIDLEKSVDDGK